MGDGVGVIPLGTAEDEDVVLPAVALPPLDVLFPDVAFCANEGVVVEFSAATTTAKASTTAAAIKFSSCRRSMFLKKYKDFI